MYVDDPQVGSAALTETDRRLLRTFEQLIRVGAVRRTLLARGRTHGLIAVKTTLSIPCPGLRVRGRGGHNGINTVPPWRGVPDGAHDDAVPFQVQGLW